MAGLIYTSCTDWQKARSVNATDTSFPSKIPTVTEPKGDAGTATGASVIETGLASGHWANAVVLVPYAIGDDDDVFAMRVIGWSRMKGPTPATRDLWIPTILAELTCTVSTAVGIAGAAVLNTERFADTITLVTGNDDISVDITSPTGNVIAHATVDLKGFSKIELTFDMTTGDPTSANCLLRFI